MKAIIMAGGQGTRLRPLTSNQPKPMIRIANLPCMEHIVNLLARHDFTDVTVTLQFMPEEIQDYFGDGSDWGVNMRYSIEDAPAGTAGSVKMAEQQLGLHGERFLIISGDALTDANLSQVVRFHEEKSAEATMVLKSVENPLDFGIVITEEDGCISRFLEKPAWGQVFSDTVNTGIYLLEPSVMDEIPDPEEGEYDFSKELFPKLLDRGRPLYGFVTDAYWEDIGTLEQYASAQRDVLDGKVRGIRPPGTRLRENIYVGRRAQVDDEELEGPVVIGDNVRIEESAKVSPYTVIGNNVVISAGATLERSIVAEGTYIGEGAELIDTLVGRNSYVQPRARILERSSLGDDVIVGEGATIAPEVKVYPHKTIESGANVTQSLIYETMGLRTVFKGGIVSGKFNVDLTPEFVVRLSSSFGTTLDPGAVVTLGRDSSASALVAKRAMTAALLGTGVNVRDLGAAHAGVVRHDVLAGKSSAGAHVRAGEDPDDVEILFFSSDATPMTESDQRSVEKVFVREEYRRAYTPDVGDLIFPGRAVEQYVERLGCVVGPSSEDVQFVDDRGEFVPPDVMLACLMDRLHPAKVVLPINLSHGYTELVESGGGTVESSRTGLGNVAIKAAGVGADLASLADGRYIFPAFLPAPDCFMTLARALEAFGDEPLSQTRAKFGERFGNVARERLECPWAAKGRVMRGLAEKFGGDPDAILTDGVKLNVEGGWVLMLPDPDNPVFYVYAEPEGGNGAHPRELMGEYVELVRSLIDGQD